MGRIYRKYTRELLTDAVRHSTSVAGVLRHLQLVPSGGNHAHISRTIKAMGLDTSHFIRHQNGSSHSSRRLTAEQILVLRPPGSRRTKPPHLRRALIEVGRTYECELCRNEGVWRDEALRLHVDHIDGNYLNNVRDNLRFLCPNCHSQTANFAGRSRGRHSLGQTSSLPPGP